MSRDASGFVGGNNRNKTVSEMISFQKSISSKVSEIVGALEKALSGRKPTAQHRRELQTLLKALDNYKNEAATRKLSFIKSRERIYIKPNKQVEIAGNHPAHFYVAGERLFRLFY